jgi:iron complex transport system substrate-binding protein
VATRETVPLTYRAKSLQSMTKLRILLVVLVAGIAAAFALFRGPRQVGQQTPGKLRIVSLAPNVTEILFALGLGEQIVGVTDQCNYPPVAETIVRVSGFGTPSVEKLLALGPDMVIACGLEKPQFTDVLRQAGIQVVNVQEVGFMASFPQLFESIGKIGAATGCQNQAKKLVAGMQKELDQVAAEVGAINDVRRVRVFIEIEESPLMTAGAGSFIDDLIHRAGGRNVAHEIAGAYPRIDPEKVIAWDPDVILVAHSDRPGEAATRLARHIGWSDISAVRNRRVIDDIDADLLFRPGPRLVDGVKALAAKLHRKQGGD